MGMSKKSKRVSLIVDKIISLECELTNEKRKLNSCQERILNIQRHLKINPAPSKDKTINLASMSSEKQSIKLLLTRIAGINIELETAHQQLQTLDDKQVEQENNLMIMRLREKELELEILKLKSQNPTPENLDQIISELKGE